MKIWQGYCTMVKRINKASIYVAVASVIIMALLITTEIVCRSFFGFSTLLADEFGGYLLATSIFFTGAYALGDNGFLRVDVFYTKFRGRGKKFADFIIWSTALAYCCFLLRLCYHVVQSSFAFGATSPYWSHTPMVIPQSLMLLGMFMVLLQVIVDLGNVFILPPDAEPEVIPAEIQELQELKQILTGADKEVAE